MKHLISLFINVIPYFQENTGSHLMERIVILTISYLYITKICDIVTLTKPSETTIQKVIKRNLS